MINLEDLDPQTGEFTLKQLPEKIVRLRPISLKDEIWLKSKYGSDISLIFLQVKMREICEIVFNQIEDKAPFKKRKVIKVDEDGNATEHFIGGVELLMNLISGEKEKTEMINALSKTIGVSRPILDAIEEEIEKKKSLIGDT